MLRKALVASLNEILATKMMIKSRKTWMTDEFLEIVKKGEQTMLIIGNEYRSLNMKIGKKCWQAKKE